MTVVLERLKLFHDSRTRQIGQLCKIALRDIDFRTLVFWNVRCSSVGQPQKRCGDAISRVSQRLVVNNAKGEVHVLSTELPDPSPGLGVFGDQAPKFRKRQVKKCAFACRHNRRNLRAGIEALGVAEPETRPEEVGKVRPALKWGDLEGETARNDATQTVVW